MVEVRTGGAPQQNEWLDKKTWRSQQAEARWKCPSTRPSKGFFVSAEFYKFFFDTVFQLSLCPSRLHTAYLDPIVNRKVLHLANYRPLRLGGSFTTSLHADVVYDDDEYPAPYGIGHRPSLLGSRQHATTK